MRALAAAALFFAAPSALAEDAPRVYAIVIGVNDAPGQNLRPLRFADDDAARTYELLSAYADEVALLATLDAETQRQHDGIGGHARPATAGALHDVVAGMSGRVAEDRRAGRTTELLFVYAGHGFVDDAGLPALALEGGRLGRDSLARDVIGAIGADRVHVILDACHAGELVGARGGWRDDQAEMDHTELLQRYMQQGSLEAMSSLGYVVSGSADEETHEWAEYRAGVFSHQVRSGLLGAADVNGDGVIEYSELGAFVASANRSVEDPRARLAVRFRPPPVHRRAPIIDLRRARFAHVLYLAPELEGHFRIEDARGVRHADVNKEAGFPTSIALPDQPFFHVRRDEREARITPGRARVVRAADLRWTAIALASRGAVGEAFRRGLYATPYGPRFYGGWVTATGEVPAERRQGRLWVEEPTTAAARSPEPSPSPAHVAAARTAGEDRRIPLGRGPVFWTGVAITGTLAIAATVTGVSALSARDDYDRARPADRRDRYESLETLTLATDVLVDAAIVTGLATTALFLLAGPSDTATRPRPTGATAALHVGDRGAILTLASPF